ncbi:MAG: MarR family transcriptional regulator [Saprospiraceae bacterium]|nr:MarR family transcriptional regulator [Saprospiraceae bacterium]
MEIQNVIKQSRFKDGYHKAMINLFYTSNYFRDVHLKIFIKYNIQGQHFNILRILKGKHPEHVSPGYIKEVMLDKGRDITRLIDKLVVKGWVNRCICPDNKRKMDISLTESGMEAINKITSEVNQSDMNLKTLSEEEYHLLSNLLDKMRG